MCGTRPNIGESFWESLQQNNKPLKKVWNSAHCHLILHSRSGLARTCLLIMWMREQVQRDRSFFKFFFLRLNFLRCCCSCFVFCFLNFWAKGLQRQCAMLKETCHSRLFKQNRLGLRCVNVLFIRFLILESPDAASAKMLQQSILQGFPIPTGSNDIRLPSYQTNSSSPNIKARLHGGISFVYQNESTKGTQKRDHKQHTRFWGFFTRTSLRKFTQSGGLCCQISLQDNNMCDDKSANKQVGETTEHYAQAAAHYPCLTLSGHTYNT